MFLVALLAWTCARAEAQARPAPAAAPAPSAQEEARSASDAREAFLEGLDHYEHGRFQEAIDAFERAAAIVPSADLWFNIARAYEELHDYGAAAESYRRYLRDRVEPPDAEAVQARIASLEARAETERQSRDRPATGRLVVRADRPGAEVRLDGEVSATTPVPAPLVVAPERHRLELTHEGDLPFRAEVRVEPGMTAETHAVLTPATEYRTLGRRRIFTWVLAGLAVASLGTSIGLGVHAVHVKNDGDLPSARDWARYSDYATGGTIVFSVSGLVTFFLEGRASETERVPPAVP